MAPGRGSDDEQERQIGEALAILRRVEPRLESYDERIRGAERTTENHGTRLVAIEAGMARHRDEHKAIIGRVLLILAGAVVTFGGAIVGMAITIIKLWQKMPP